MFVLTVLPLAEVSHSQGVTIEAVGKKTLPLLRLVCGLEFVEIVTLVPGIILAPRDGISLNRML